MPERMILSKKVLVPLYFPATLRNRRTDICYFNMLYEDAKKEGVCVCKRKCLKIGTADTERNFTRASPLLIRLKQKLLGVQLLDLPPGASFDRRYSMLTVQIILKLGIFLPLTSICFVVKVLSPSPFAAIKWIQKLHTAI